jgi:hypothetical protein
MKTKDNDKTSLSPGVSDLTPTHRPLTAGRNLASGFSTSRFFNLSAARSREQSENVYENKGQ